MNKQEPEINASAEMYESPQWLEDVLRLSLDEPSLRRSETKFEPPSEAFRQRCQEAADIAASIMKLRRERQRIGFVPMSLADYIQGLIKVAGVQLTTVLARFGVEDVSLSTPGSARKLASLGKELGIGLREILAHVRIGFVEKIDSVPVPLLLAHHRSAGLRDQLGECEAVLGLVEAEYDAERLNELRRTEFEIRAAYKQGESRLDIS
jgi:hypothetical protein